MSPPILPHNPTLRKMRENLENQMKELADNGYSGTVFVVEVLDNGYLLTLTNPTRKICCTAFTQVVNQLARGMNLIGIGEMLEVQEPNTKLQGLIAQMAHKEYSPKTS